MQYKLQESLSGETPVVTISVSEDNGTPCGSTDLALIQGEALVDLKHRITSAAIELWDIHNEGKALAAFEEEKLAGVREFLSSIEASLPRNVVMTAAEIEAFKNPTSAHIPSEVVAAPEEPSLIPAEPVPAEPALTEPAGLTEAPATPE